MKAVSLGALHGYGVLLRIQQISGSALTIEQGALYPALQRLEERGWISAKWGTSSNNRKARFYSLTAKGREQLVEKTSEWERLTRAMELILSGSPGPGTEEA